MLNELAKRIHKNARAKGFWDLDEQILQNVADVEKSHMHNLILTEKTALAITELAEGIEALRKNKRANLNFEATTVEEWGKCLFDQQVKDTFEDEIADTIIRLLDLCAYENIDIDEHIKLKMGYNELRPRLHGKDF